VAGAYLCSGKLNLDNDFDTLLTGLTHVVPVSFTRENGIYKIKIIKE
jgi:hypothetical protein